MARCNSLCALIKRYHPAAASCAPFWTFLRQMPWRFAIDGKFRIHGRDLGLRGLKESRRCHPNSKTSIGLERLRNQCFDRIEHLLAVRSQLSAKALLRLSSQSECRRPEPALLPYWLGCRQKRRAGGAAVRGPLALCPLSQIQLDARARIELPLAF